MDLDLYLKQMETLVNIDSGSRSPAGITKVADHLEAWYKEAGWFVKSHDLGPETARLLEISNHENCSHYDVMFIGHMDTVFEDGTAAARPFTIDGDYYYGPGVGDMKNGDLAMLHVALNAKKETLDQMNICMCYNPDEEIGSVYSRDVSDAIATKSDCVVVMESSGHLGARHCFDRKGGYHCNIAFHGIACHAGFMWETEHASAILEMANAITKIMALGDKEKLTSVNVGVCKGGTVGNAVADYAEINVDSRILYDDERTRIKNAIHEIVAKPTVPGCHAEILNERMGTPMLRNEKTAAYVKRLYKMAEEMGIPFEDKLRGGGSDGTHLARCGDLIVLDGMGPHGTGDHSDKEKGYIPSVKPCVQLLCAMLDDMAGLKAAK